MQSASFIKYYPYHAHSTEDRDIGHLPQSEWNGTELGRCPACRASRSSGEDGMNLHKAEIAEMLKRITHEGLLVTLRTK
jgi:hypothetical protein